jgi:ubiquinone/menaquinone biosynthesis C-methylase UbiE
MDTQPQYFAALAAAFVRGKAGQPQYAGMREANPALFVKALEELSDDELHALIQLGRAYELRVHRFKRSMKLPRVHKIMGILRGIQPHSLLDIGSGRGAFLWPQLNAFPWLPVTCIDLLSYRVADIQAVRDGGWQQLTAMQGDATALPFADHSFDVVTMLEVLEHIPTTIQALKEVCRVARRFLLLSVPSREDNNPEHIHLFSKQRLTELLQELGVARVSVEYVLNHMIIIARIEHE